MNDTSKTILAFVGGALAGAAVGILLAPDKGSNLRKKIADSARDMSDDLTETADEKYQEFKNWKSRLRDRAGEEVDRVKGNVDRVRRNAQDQVDNIKRNVTQKVDDLKENGTDQVRRTPPRNAEI
jgi:gas vesicle protein